MYFMDHTSSGSDECCSVCARRVGINDSDEGTPPVDLGRCAAPGGFECRAVGQAVAGYRRDNASLERRLKKAEVVVMMARQLTAYAWEDSLVDCKVSDDAKRDSHELGTAVWLYDQEPKS